jgi:hypothetical protein
MRVREHDDGAWLNARRLQRRLLVGAEAGCRAAGRLVDERFEATRGAGEMADHGHCSRAEARKSHTLPP